ncbi:MAG: hypothetical protein KBA71_09275 [Opitutaceae bacterium]|nr:hypothetical protein [Opitutaceae bacterium]
MAFFAKFFGRGEPDETDYFGAMKEFASEAERTYLGMIRAYNHDVEIGMLKSPRPKEHAIATSAGLYLIRLFGSSFALVAYAKSGASPQQVSRLANGATALAFNLADSQRPPFPREEAGRLVDEVLKPILENISEALRDGIAIPGNFSANHKALARWLDRALEESLGVERYTPEVRYRFQTLIEANVSLSITQTLRWIQ